MIFKLNAQVFTYFALTSDQPLSKLSSLQQFSALAKNQTAVKILIVDCELFIIIISAEKSPLNSSHQAMPPYGSTTCFVFPPRNLVFLSLNLAKYDRLMLCHSLRLFLQKDCLLYQTRFPLLSAIPAPDPENSELPCVPVFYDAVKSLIVDFQLFIIISAKKSPSNASHQVMHPYLIYHVTPTPTGR
ncbi:hypothetical protein OUZ56_006515 [Daphnia magna]|uniref:Uncharacterized protein n=1 Tax=Daphnia magna TaxID=35525 RepID=A0ABQ9YVW8_9CRUS|nr:hypothetical protein OUZ56_006515 [Daphnia magna]